MSGPTQPFDGTPSWEGVFQHPPKPKLPPNPNAIRPIAGGGGPQTEAGKAISSGNSTTHGLTAKRAVLPGEDQSEFDALLNRLTVDLNPQGELEIQLTGEVAAVIWRLNRARDHEARFFETNRDPYDRGAPKLELIMRYSGSIERHMHRTIARLELCQKQRRNLAATEFVSQLTENKAAEAAPLVMAAGASVAGQAPPDAPAVVEAPEFVSQPEENTPETAPLVMVAGRSLPYDYDAPCEPLAPAKARKSVSQGIDFYDPSFDPFVRFPHIKELENELERAVRERILRDGC